MINNEIRNKTFDEERALYHLSDTLVSDCQFSGPADGESALKEARNIVCDGCRFDLRYPLWHVKGLILKHSLMAETARAALWYTSHGEISDCNLAGIKVLRECDNIRIRNCEIISAECGWKCRNVDIAETDINSEYFGLNSHDISLYNVSFKGKYSFQYTENVTIENCFLDTKDAFWHAKNVTVRYCTIKGEYLGWYSEGLTLISCRIIGTQPLCYARNLKMVDCEMEGADLAFEYSSVDAKLDGSVVSIKNPSAGHIECDSVGEIILDDAVYPTECEIVVRDKK